MTLTIGLLIALVVPIAGAIMSIRTGKYFYNLVVTGACAVLLMLCPDPMKYLPLILFLVISIVGDYFMGHQQHSHSYYLFGIIGFFLAHVCLVWYTFDKVSVEPWLLVVGGLLAVGYGVYLAIRILPDVDNNVMRVALCAYASVSVLSVTMMIGTPAPLITRVLMSLGTASILFSDTIISECDFAGNEKLSHLIMPTYFACHILIVAGALAALL
ncbi:lysoplasmalogenase [Eubacteriales bacterium OttesenSCG-928-N13]|nr:lysoplasmalogenase [Eubacteriales bacterium OttesenSCG-928-N13]